MILIVIVIVMALEGSGVSVGRAHGDAVLRGFRDGWGKWELRWQGTTSRFFEHRPIFT